MSSGYLLYRYLLILLIMISASLIFISGSSFTVITPVMKEPVFLRSIDSISISNLLFISLIIFETNLSSGDASNNASKESFVIKIASLPI
ncbi:MAG: hypothetical protein LM586_02675 [Desulfurococcales archaeon]|nr:hypothetical protein [Desulfurococcales archaeon]MCC6062607.1 hypothetical protein [Desulfurococcales archaeon]